MPKTFDYKTLKTEAKYGRRVNQFEIIPIGVERAVIFRGKRAQHPIRESTRIDERPDGTRRW